MFGSDHSRFRGSIRRRRRGSGVAGSAGRRRRGQIGSRKVLETSLSRSVSAIETSERRRDTEDSGGGGVAIGIGSGCQGLVLAIVKERVGTLSRGGDVWKNKWISAWRGSAPDQLTCSGAVCTEEDTWTNLQRRACPSLGKMRGKLTLLIQHRCSREKKDPQLCLGSRAGCDRGRPRKH